MKEIFFNDLIISRTAQDGTFQSEGFPETGYGLSKIGVTVMTMIQQREMDKKGADDIVINAVSMIYSCH